MKLGKVHILPTDITPQVILDPEGIITIKGRSQTLNATNFPTQITDWIDEYLYNPAESTKVNIEFEYINSYGTKILISFLQKISEVLLQNKKLIIHWYFDEDDDDILERGQYISEALNMPFKYIMINSSSD
jgi:hypothetical protein